MDTGDVETVVPLTVPIEEWLDTRKSGLDALGITLVEEED